MQLLGSTLALVAAVLPLLVLGGIALLGHMIGEWGRGALLAYAAVMLGFVCGVGAAQMATPPGHVVAALGVVIAVVALALGGPTGATVLAVAYALSTALLLAKPQNGLPWLLPAVAAAACLIVVLRDRS